jgi:excisionase family DNA binding protein
MEELFIIREKLFTEKYKTMNEISDLLEQLMDESLNIFNQDTDKIEFIKKQHEELILKLQTTIKELNFTELVMGVEEAADLWNLSPGYIKNLCAEGKINAKKIGKTWVIDKNQPNPSRSS